MVAWNKVGCAIAVALLAVLANGCNGGDNADDGIRGKPVELANVPVPPEDGPRIASVDKATPIFEQPDLQSPKIGLMRAGATVARAKEAIGTEGCPGGWYPIRPRGFVCAGKAASINLEHPTLKVMKTQPNRQGPLPYNYRNVNKETPIYAWDRAKGAAVREVGKLKRRSRFAVVGSWSAQLPSGDTAKLAMMPDGNFVNAEHLEESTGSDFRGTSLDEQNQLPIAFVVRRGIRAWELEGKKAQKSEKLEPRSMVQLTGRFRTIADVKFWATSDGSYVRHRDVTSVRRRNKLPTFATGDQKWIDVSVITGTLVMYEGAKPVFATLCSVGHDRLGDPETGPTTKLGTFHIVGKHLTTSQPGSKPFAENLDVIDVPWAQMLSSGQTLHGALWHSRFGIEYGPGNVQLSPADAAHLFAWTSPVVPEGWHAVLKQTEGTPKVIVHIRK